LVDACDENDLNIDGKIIFDKKLELKRGYKSSMEKAFYS